MSPKRAQITNVGKDWGKKKEPSCMYPYVHSSIIYICQDMDVTEVSINRWVNKEDVVCLHSRILLSHRNNEITPFSATGVNLEDIMLSETNETEKDIYCMISLICGMWKIQQPSDYNKKAADFQTQKTNQWFPVWTGKREEKWEDGD